MKYKKNYFEYNSKLIEHWSAEGTIFTNDMNVGILTNNPQARLDVNGDIKSSGDIYLKKRNGNMIIDGVDYDPILRLKTNSDADGWTIRNDVPNNNIFSIGKDDNKNILNIKEDGNIGINNINPNHTLDIYGSRNDSLLNIENNNINGIGMSISASKNALQIVDGDDKTKKYFTISGNGNVGIGVENPNNSLEINKSTNNQLVRINNSHTDGSGIIIGADNYPLKIGKSNSYEGEIMTIKGNGNVGINEKNPKNKLVVNGTIQANEFVNKDGVKIGGDQNSTLDATTICLNNGKTGEEFEKLCVGLNDLKFITDFKKSIQGSVNDNKSWIFTDNNENTERSINI